MQERWWRPEWACPVVPILAQQRHGGSDPTWRRDKETVWRGVRTPAGPATLAVTVTDSGEVRGQAWGEGSDWVLDTLPALLGATDDWSGFEGRHPVLVEARRRHPHARLGRSGLVLESLVPAIIEQKVTGQEAFAGFRMLCHRYGVPAPGPGAERGLRLPPSPEALRRIPSWAWLRMHIDGARSKTIVAVARVADSLERTVGLEPEVAEQRMRSLPGVGEWTCAEVRMRTFGDPDAVSFGDYHVAKDVGWALTGTPFTDEEMREYLEPWRPQRGRVPALIAMAGLHRPRRGPRMAPREHLPTPTRRP